MIIKIEMQLHELQTLSDALLMDIIWLYKKEREGTSNSEMYKKAKEAACDIMLKIDNIKTACEAQHESEALYHMYGTDH